MAGRLNPSQFETFPEPWRVQIVGEFEEQGELPVALQRQRHRAQVAEIVGAPEERQQCRENGAEDGAAAGEQREAMAPSA